MKIIKSLEPVLEQSNYVSINSDNVRNFARSFDRSKLSHWLSISPFDFTELGEAEKIGFLFALDTISFSYWGTPKWKVEYREKEYDGAQAMIACLGRAIERGRSFTPHYFANLKREDLEEVLRGNVEIPLLNERLRNLNEVGTITLRTFKGDFRYIVDKTQNDAVQLVDLLVNNFPSFQDSSVYKGKKVEFSKRAQLLASDFNYLVWNLRNTNKLTACADYKLPQVLRRYGILEYNDELQRKIRGKIEIPVGSEEEVEIRAHTIYAVELIKEKIGGVTSSQVNDYLWLEGQVKLPTDEPYHLTRTTAY